MTIADLPIELLRACFCHLDGPNAGQQAVRERARALSSCCLVNKIWRAIAQPMLFERVHLALAPSINGEEQEPVRAPNIDRASIPTTADRPAAFPAFLAICQERPDLARHTTWLRIKQSNTQPRGRTSDPRVPTLLRSLPSLRDLLVCGGIELDLAWLGLPTRASHLNLHPDLVADHTLAPGLETVHVWGINYRSSGPVVCPSLRLFSSCGASFPRDPHDFFTPRSLPRLQTFALVFSGSLQTVDLSALPPSVRVVVNSNLRGPGDQVADNVLYMTRFDTIMPDQGRQGSLADCLNTEKVYHLCLIDVFATDPAREFLRALKEESCLAPLRTLRIESRSFTIPDSGELADLIRARRITVVSLNGWRGQPSEAPMIPPGWE